MGDVLKLETTGWLQPVGERVVVKREEPSQTPGGLYIPQTSSGKVARGRVVQVGSGPSFGHVYCGAVVVYPSASGLEVQCGTETLVVLKLEDVIAVVHGGA